MAENTSGIRHTVIEQVFLRRGKLLIFLTDSEFISFLSDVYRYPDQRVMKNKYLLLTNDTEALPNRAKDNHVKRLMWGEHENGTAGVREMTSVVKEFNGKITYFVDICGAMDRKAEVLEVAKWLNDNGQDVELHLHPEYLPDEFWEGTGYRLNPRFMNLYEEVDKDKLRFLLKTCAGELENVIGRKINAYRAGSFRWNSLTLELLKELDIPMAFNNTQASVALGQCPYASSMQRPFRWSNGIIEVPVTEKNFFPNLNDNWWVRYQYPLCSLVRYRTGLGSIIPYSVSAKDDFLVCLMHSWSFLYRDDDGYEYYKDDHRKEDFRKMLRKMSRDFDIIDSRDLKELIDSGKITVDHTEDIKNTVYIPANLKRPRLTREQIKNKNYAYLSNEVEHNGSYDHSFFSDKRFYYGMSCCLFPSMIYEYIQPSEEDLRMNENLRQFKFAYEGKDGDIDSSRVTIGCRMLNKVEKVRYIPLNVNFEIRNFLFCGKLPVRVEVESEQDIMFGLYLYDSEGQKIDSRTFHCNCNALMDVPENTVTFAISLRIPEDFKSAVIKYISFTFVDTVSTHVIPIVDRADTGTVLDEKGRVASNESGGEQERNADSGDAEFKIEDEQHDSAVRDTKTRAVNYISSYDNYFRLAVYHPEKKKNGVIIFFPENKGFGKKHTIDYPDYSGSCYAEAAQKLTGYTVINVAEPYLTKKYKYGGSWFFNEQGRSLLPELAGHIRNIIGSDCGDILCAGHSMGADLAISFAPLIKAKYCICESVHPSLLKYPNFRKMGYAVALAQSKLSGKKTEIKNIESPAESATTKADRIIRDHYEEGMLDLHSILNKSKKDIPSAVYFSFYNMNQFIPVLFQEIKRVDREARKNLDYKVLINGSGRANKYSCLPADELVRLIANLMENSTCF